MAVKLNHSLQLFSPVQVNQFFSTKSARSLAKIEKKIQAGLVPPHLSPSQPVDQRMWQSFHAQGDLSQAVNHFYETSRQDVLLPAKNRPKERLVESNFFPVHIPSAVFKDPKMQVLFATDGKEVNYSLEEANTGVCQGMMVWFLNLLFLSLQKHPEIPIDQHLYAIADNLKLGAGKAPIALQLMGLGENQLLGMATTKTIQVRNFNQKPALFYKKFNELPPGIYSYSLEFVSEKGESIGHGCPLIKVSDQVAYIFDPNFGLIRREGENLAELVYHHAQLNYTGFSKRFKGAVHGTVSFHSMMKEGVDLEPIFPSEQEGWRGILKTFFGFFVFLFSVFFNSEDE